MEKSPFLKLHLHPSLVCNPSLFHSTRNSLPCINSVLEANRMWPASEGALGLNDTGNLRGVIQKSRSHSRYFKQRNFILWLKLHKWSKSWEHKEGEVRQTRGLSLPGLERWRCDWASVALGSRATPPRKSWDCSQPAWLDLSPHMEGLSRGSPGPLKGFSHYQNRVPDEVLAPKTPSCPLCWPVLCYGLTLKALLRGF